MLVYDETQLRELRKSRKLKQKDVAKVLGVSQSTINNIESSLSIPNFRQIVKLCNEYNVPLSYFVYNK